MTHGAWQAWVEGHTEDVMQDDNRKEDVSKTGQAERSALRLWVLISRGA